MLPKIQPEDLCVFEKYGAANGGSRDGKIVLVRQSSADDDYGCQYTIKEYHSEKDPQTGRNVKVELRPLNSQYPTIEINEADQVDVMVVLKCVL